MPEPALITIGHWLPIHSIPPGGGQARKIPQSWFSIPRRLWPYQPKPRLILLGRPESLAPFPELVLRPEAGEIGRRRTLESGLGTAVIHAAVGLWVLTMPVGPKLSPEEMQLALRYNEPVTLVAPAPELLRQLTGSAPAVSEVNLNALMAEPGPAPASADSAPAPVAAPPAAPVAEPEPEAPPEPDPERPIEEPAEIEPLEEAAEATDDRPRTLGPGAPEPSSSQPDQPPAENPVIAFENVGPGTFGAPSRPGSVSIGNPSEPPAPAIPPAPSSNVQEAIREVSRLGGGIGAGMVIGDVEIAPGVLEPHGAPPSKNNTGSNVKLLSDPMGVDFRPYLIRVLASVRRNWFAVMPESARLGRRGRVVIQFSIGRQGNVPKLVIAMPSGAEPLDRAAVAGISASNPFPPLPQEFRGDEIRLQLNFTYNVNR